MSGAVGEPGTIQAISSRTMQPKPRLNFLSTSRVIRLSEFSAAGHAVADKATTLSVRPASARCAHALHEQAEARPNDAPAALGSVHFQRKNGMADRGRVPAL